MITTSNLGALMGAKVLGPDNDKIGTVGQVFVDPIDGRPNWMTVHTGWFGLSQSFVPLDTATWDHECVHIQFDKDVIKDAPRIDTDGALTQQEEHELYQYYSMPHGEDDDHDDKKRDAHDAHDARYPSVEETAAATAGVHSDSSSTRGAGAHVADGDTDVDSDRENSGVNTNENADVSSRSSAPSSPSSPSPSPSDEMKTDSSNGTGSMASSDTVGAGSPLLPPTPPSSAGGSRMRKYVVTEVFLEDDPSSDGNRNGSS